VSTLTKEQQEAINWASKHRANVETRNKILISIAIIAELIFFGGYVNYNMLLGLANTHLLIQFFGEFGLIFPLLFINMKIVVEIKLLSKEDAAVAVAAAVAEVAVVVAAAAVAVAAVAVAAAAVAAVVVAMILEDD
jgi:hypothetical protein